uniref:LLM class flavin-dependent oxidoreductase n=1 Tax=Phenylobacterium glaciei TaxID=2803784 RepID=A0A974S9X6_9CAUL|nr:LLM class flavin-dependent oxidoreductase [Phenylobacterium glaciei]
METMHILRTLLNGEALDFDGEFYRLKVEPPRIRTVSGKSPQFYFGGLSEDAREAAAKGCDVYLMWPDKQEAVKEILADMTARATRHGRKLKFGYRVHVVVRETEADARAAAERLLSHLDAPAGDAIRAKSLDSQSVGSVARPSCARAPPMTAMPRPTSGPASAGPARAAGRPLSAIPTRCWPSCRPTRPWASTPSSSRAIRTPPRPTCSPATSCPG